MKPYKVSDTEEWSLPREGAECLAVTTTNGAIDVLPGDPDRIGVRATKQVRGRSEEAARAFLQEIRIERRRDQDRWVIEATWPRPLPADVESPEVRFEIAAPREMRLEARSSNGAIHATGMAEVALQSSNGAVVAREITGPCAVRTSNGRVEVDACTGPVEARSDNGALVLSAVRAPLHGHTSNGGINASLASDAGTADVELTTSNGGIEATLPGTLSARLEAGTSLGSIEVATEIGARQSARGRLETVLGSGEGRVRLRTSNGSIRVKLAAAR
jgi:DUF4097 and DUF4098 domain-containing protein YvlB